VSPQDIDFNDILDRSKKAFSQGKWIDSASILSETLERMTKSDISGMSPEDLTEEQKKDLAIEGVVRVRLGHSLRRMGKFQEAQVEFQRAKGIGELIGDDGIWADSLLGMGFFEWGRGNYSKAKTLFWEAIERANRVKDLAIKGRAYMGLGNIALVTRRMEEGVSAFTKALAHLEQVEGTEIEQARVMHNQAFVIFKQGRRTEAEEAFKRCIDFSEAQGDLSTSGFAYSSSG